jgi:CRISPR/Cas system-associated endonuclease Cas1
LGENGYFEGQVCGSVSGNVLLWKKQYQKTDNIVFFFCFVRNLLYCKIKHSKTVLLRYTRNSRSQETVRNSTFFLEGKVQIGLIPKRRETGA